MNTRHIIIIGAALTLTANADVTDRKWKEPRLYGASFDAYSVDEPLVVNKGTWSGKWNPVSSGAVTAAGKSSDRSYMDFCGNASDPTLCFLPSEYGSRTIKMVVSSVFLVGSEELFDPPSSFRAGFSLLAPDGKSPTFVGWSASGWQALSAEGIEPISGHWYTVAIRMIRLKGERVRVQYSIKDGNRAVLLANAAGQTWLDVGGDASSEVVRSVEYRGDGRIEYLHGGNEPPGLKIQVE